MLRLRPAVIVLILFTAGGCTPQFQRREPPKAVIEEGRDRPKEAIPRFTYRPGRGLTIAGDP